MGVVTGKSMAHLCRINLSDDWKRILIWVMAEIAIIGSDLQEVLGSAIALNILFGLQIWIGILLTVTTTLLILLIQIYGMKTMEIIFFGFVGMMTICFFIDAFKSDPNWA